jgi:hypothetical protein
VRTAGDGKAGGFVAEIGGFIDVAPQSVVQGRIIEVIGDGVAPGLRDG